jgi:hypothetical protein
MQSLWQQQTSRLYLRQQLAATRKQLEGVIHNLEDREIKIKDSTTQVNRRTSPCFHCRPSWLCTRRPTLLAESYQLYPCKGNVCRPMAPLL